MVIYLSEPEILLEFVDGLKKAAGSAHALAHAQGKPEWLAIRDKLEILIMAGQTLVTMKSHTKYSLDNIVANLKTTADGKLNAEVGN